MINNNNLTKYVWLIEYCEIESKFNINYVINLYKEIIQKNVNILKMIIIFVHLKQ